MATVTPPAAAAPAAAPATPQVSSGRIVANAQSQEVTDGFHLVIDALKLNGIDTIFGLPGIPITDLTRMAQAEGHARDLVPPRAERRQRRRHRRLHDAKARHLPDGVRARASSTA